MLTDNGLTARSCERYQCLSAAQLIYKIPACLSHDFKSRIDYIFIYLGILKLQEDFWWI
jgi:hypothetical protein